MTKRGQWTNVTLREIAWLAAFVFWAYYKKPADKGFLDFRPGPLAVIGIVLIVTGIVAHIWSAMVLAEAIYNPAGLNHNLARQGPYRYVRNPIYITGAIVLVGIYLLYAEFRLVDLVAAVV